MGAPKGQYRAAESRVVSSSDRQWHKPNRSYRAPHQRDWLILAFFALLPIATGLDVAHELGWATQAGRLALLVAFVIAGLWAEVFYALRIAVLVRVSETGLGVHQGPWHGEITWRDMRRLSERARPAGDATERWIVAEGEDGRRLTIPAASIADYERFVSDVNTAFTDWRAHAAQPLRDSVRQNMPYLAAERGRPIGWLNAAGVSLGVVGVMLIGIARAWSWPGVVMVALGGALLALAVRRRLDLRTLVLNDQGVELRSRRGASRLAWSAITGVERRGVAGNAVMRALRRLAGKAVHLMLSLDKWTDGVEWSEPAPLELIIKGAGRRLRLRLDRIDEPADLLAHLELRLRVAAEIRAATPPVRRVTQRLASIPQRTAPPRSAPEAPAQIDASAPAAEK